MQPIKWDDRYQPADAEIVKRMSKRYAGRSGFSVSDAPDIEQDLAQHVAMNSCKHDPNQGPRERFIRKIAKNRMLNLIEQRNARKRNDRRTTQFNDGTDGADVTQEQRLDLRMDLAAALAAMPADLKQVWELRLGGRTEAELKSAMKKTRSQVRTLMSRLEKFLAASGLDPKSE